MSSKVYEVLNALDQQAFAGKEVIRDFDMVCRIYGTEYLAQYIAMDTFPNLYQALNKENA